MLRFAVLLAFCAFAFGAESLEFNRDIRPILSGKCFACHGPDSVQKRIPLRLDREEDAKKDLGGRHGIVAGDAEASELIRRITSTNKAKRMPPVYTGATLTPREVELIKKWIDSGAKWQKHWAYIAPVRPDLPAVNDTAWPANPIDRFVLARLEKEGLRPSPQASPSTLLRRVTLDLTGLPPTPQEIAEFLKDPSPAAYEKNVDRLLASPRYGERMAMRWLDAARYADTNGYQSDGERSMWRWRDWVIAAFQQNEPFDRFTVEQLAGDYLPNPAPQQLIATGFNRNHRGNGEGGIVPEEYLVEYAVDRVETMSAVWLGSTMGCGRCHNHKYDPFTQREFYQMIAYFDKIPERGRYFKYGNTPPLIPAPTTEQSAELQIADQKVAEAERQFTALQAKTEKGLAAWSKSLQGQAPRWAPTEAQAFEHVTPETFDGVRVVDAGKKAPFGYFDQFTLAARVNPDSPTGTILSKTEDEDEGNGYGLILHDGKLQVNLSSRWLDDALRVITEQPLATGRWTHIAVTYDGSRVAAGIRVYLDGKPAPVKVLLDELNQEFRNKEPLRIGGGYGPALRFHGRIEEVRAYSRLLAAEEIDVLSGKSVSPAALRRAYLEQFGPADVREAWARLGSARRQREALVASFPTVMIMRDEPDVRQTHVLDRGVYDRPRDAVSPAVPAALHALPADAPANRLGLAQWIVDPQNPLTARVTVNRFWGMFFGQGLVTTAEDFGSQGEWPTHPELLDWLAVEFREKNWDVKHIIKTIVMSQTYRQSSRITPESAQKDPGARLLSRAPRYRLPAETIRDQALFASGLLVEQVGGPSVKPYQPDGLWSELSGQEYKRDSGEKLYRRSLYIYWKRSAPPPFMATFDAPSREACAVREGRTNTPMQALNLMNDVAFLEASRKMAERMMREGGASADERIRYGFLLATARAPQPRELAVLADAWRQNLDRFQTDPAMAEKLLSQGEAPRVKALNVTELAAYANVASLLLNLDEAVTRE